MLASPSSPVHPPCAPLVPVVESHTGRVPDMPIRVEAVTRAGLEQYDLDPLTGFMSSQEPIQRLNGQAAPWEDLWNASSGLELHGGSDRAKRWRERARAMRIVTDISFLTTARHLQRAHALLTSLAQRYYFCMPPPPAQSETVLELPDSISVPLQAVSDSLDMPPMITYADTSFYSWRYVDPEAGFNIDNIDVNLSFTGTRSERHFYLVPLVIEYTGAPALKLIPLLLDELNHPHPSRDLIASQLNELARIIDGCAAILNTMSPICVPEVFYRQIRPWLNGGPRLHQGKVEDFGGPSAGQSSLMHAFDMILGVDHRPADPEDGGFEATFMMRMAAYMPAPHRAYLIDLARASPVVRSYAETESTIVTAAYNGCIDALRKLREAHMRIVNTYVVRFARADAKKAASLAQDGDNDDCEPVGTGGTQIVSFLKQTRERTMNARI